MGSSGTTGCGSNSKTQCRSASATCRWNRGRCLDNPCAATECGHVNSGTCATQTIKTRKKACKVLGRTTCSWSNTRGCQARMNCQPLTKAQCKQNKSSCRFRKGSGGAPNT